MELSHFPHALFDFTDFLLIYVEKAGRLTETRNFGDEREIVDAIQHVVEPCSLVSAILEAPKVVRCVPWSYLLTVVRDCMQGSAILTPISGYDADYMGVGTHDDSGVTCWDASSLAVSDDTGDEIDPSIKIEP